MAGSIFKFRDPATGLFWSGNRVGSKKSNFNTRGKEWSTAKSARNHVMAMGPLNSNHRYRKNMNEGFTIQDIMNLEMVEFKIVITEDKTDSVIRNVFDALVANELNDKDSFYEFSKDDFYWEMVKRKVADKIDFIFEMRMGDNGGNWLSYTARQSEMAQVKTTCKATLKQLNINSRNFREHRNMFGFLDPKLAMNARLLLSDVAVTDLRPLRQKVLGMMNLTTPP